MDGQQKDNSPQAIRPIEENLFKSGQDLYIYRKSEKICSAIHFVTNFLGDVEPLRLALRKSSIELLSHSLSFIKTSLSPESILAMSIKLAEIRSFLHTANFAGLVSEMNFNILETEIKNLLENIEIRRQPIFSLPSTFLNVPNAETPVFNEDKEQSKGHHIGQNTNVLKSPSRNLSSPTPQGDSERTMRIISLLKDGKELTIKDFSITIKGCSEKTLQRELLRLVSQGRIFKKGERRWSRYSLKK